MKITVRDGKELDVDLTLEMTRHALETWAVDNHPEHPTRGMALALEAALVKLKKVETMLESALRDLEGPPT
jgi:hypothetical protein